MSLRQTVTFQVTKIKRRSRTSPKIGEMITHNWPYDTAYRLGQTIWFSGTRGHYLTVVVAIEVSGQVTALQPELCP